MNRNYWVPATAGALIAGLVIGYWTGTAAGRNAVVEPPDWIARVGSEFITLADFEDELERRGGARGGQFADPSQREALLEELIFRRAMVARAQAAAVASEPVVKRSLDQILINHLVQTELRPRQERVAVSPERIEAFFEAHAEEYAIPARRRVAMLQIELGDRASEETRLAAYEQAREARERALELAPAVRDFGDLARQVSTHQASRHRGGIIGWIGEGDPARYSHPAVVIEAANAMTRPGEISAVLEDRDGLYLVRLVDYEPHRTRTLEELRDGISQRLLREQFNAVEAAFRHETLADAEIEWRAQALRQLGFDGPPAPRSEPQPPPVPDSVGQGGLM